jgi:hypothetical protein
MMGFPDFAVRPTSNIFLHEVPALNPTTSYCFSKWHWALQGSDDESLRISGNANAKFPV